MERILKRTIEGISLDKQSLARLAQILDPDDGDNDAVGPERKEGELLRIDDEACTMVPVGDTTTRASLPILFHFLRLELIDVSSQTSLGNFHTGTFLCESKTTLKTR